MTDDDERRSTINDNCPRTAVNCAPPAAGSAVTVVGLFPANVSFSMLHTDWTRGVRVDLF